MFQSLTRLVIISAPMQAHASKTQEHLFIISTPQLRTAARSLGMLGLGTVRLGTGLSSRGTLIPSCGRFFSFDSSSSALQRSLLIIAHKSGLIAINKFSSEKYYAR